MLKTNTGGNRNPINTKELKELYTLYFKSLGIGLITNSQKF